MNIDAFFEELDSYFDKNEVEKIDGFLTASLEQAKEEIERDFDQFLKMFTWNYLQKHFIEQGQLTVTADEAMEEAKVFAQAQFAQYGMPSAPAEMLENFAKQIMENKEQQSKVYEKLYEVKVVEYLKSQIKVSEKSISADDFAKLAKEVA